MVDLFCEQLVLRHRSLTNSLGMAAHVRSRVRTPVCRSSNDGVRGTADLRAYYQPPFIQLCTSNPPTWTQFGTPGRVHSHG